MWSSSGFTLLELMTVLLLLGLLVGAGLAFDIGGGPATQQAVAAQLAEQVKLAALETVQAGEVWGLDFFRDGATAGYRWLRQDATGWHAAEPGVLDAQEAEFRLPATLGWRLGIDGSDVQPELRQPLQLASGGANPRFRPEILLLPTREATPFVLRLCAAALDDCVATVAVDALGRVEVDDAAP